VTIADPEFRDCRVYKLIKPTSDSEYFAIVTTNDIGDEGVVQPYE